MNRGILVNSNIQLDKFQVEDNFQYFSLEHCMAFFDSIPWTQDVNSTYIRYSEDVLCPGVEAHGWYTILKILGKNKKN